MKSWIFIFRIYISVF